MDALPPSFSTFLPSSSASSLTLPPPLDSTHPANPIPAHLLRLPLEVHHEILKFCNLSTLSQTSRVSLAFLQLSGPLLYRDIFVRGVKSLEKIKRSKVNYRTLISITEINRKLIPASP